MKYKVVEIFTSIQGEGFFTGSPSVFIRLSGCNLNCSWCDTKHEEYVEMTPKEILEKIPENMFRVVITGGEPTIHDLYDLCLSLARRGCFIQLETNGTNDVNSEIFHWITCSPKRENDYKYFSANELKYVVDDDFDFSVVPDVVKGGPIIYIQPENNKSENVQKCMEALKGKPNWKLSLQVQKLIGVE